MFSTRLDRLVSLYLSRPLRRAGWGRPGTWLPILMYHSISSDSEKGVGPYYRLVTSPQRFAEHMQWLAELGYVGLALEDALPTLAQGRLNGRHPVVITSDDGFRDFHLAAWPVLRRYGFTATVYLPTGFVSGERKSFRGRQCLTWDEVRELRRHGVRFGSHTVNHPKLYELSWSQIESEARISKERIQQELQEEVTSFAYPYAFPQEDSAFRRTIAGLLREQGYRSCVTTVVGRSQAGDDPLFLKRLPINSCDDRRLFEAKLEGAYDWLGPAQYAYRRIKRSTTLRRGRSHAAQPQVEANAQ
jgi:peptidoglycan/xylan/chitin deacetylase (PgdA/CDA1 family)